MSRGKYENTAIAGGIVMIVAAVGIAMNTASVRPPRAAA